MCIPLQNDVLRFGRYAERVSAGNGFHVGTFAGGGCLTTGSEERHGRETRTVLIVQSKNNAEVK